MSAQPNDIFAHLNKAFDTQVKRPSRSERLEGLEADISRFNPNLDEGWQIIAAVLQSWKEEFPAHRLTVIEEEAKALKIAVSEAQPHEADL